MAITDLTGTTWEFSGSPYIDTSIEYSITGSCWFYENQGNYNGVITGIYLFYFEVGRPPEPAPMIEVIDDVGTHHNLCAGAWGGNLPFTLQITGGTDATNSGLISWLEANATQVVSTPQVTITYNGNTIQTITTDSTVTLPTNGKVMATDIVVSGTDIYSAEITYNGDTVATGTGTFTKTLQCANKVMASDVEVDVVIETPVLIDNYITFSSPNTFTLSVVDNTKHWDGTIEYSTDTTNWSTWTGTSAISSSQSGTTKYLYVRGSGNTVVSSNSGSATVGAWRPNGTNISISGNISKLLDYSGTPNPGTGAFRFLFGYASGSRGTAITDVRDLVLDVGGVDRVYDRAFRYNNNLVYAPIFQMDSLGDLACYYMFDGCASLLSAPELPATTIGKGCYLYMFRNCSAMMSPPSVLPATTLPEAYNNSYSGGCYGYMFYNCISLLTSPVILASSASVACCYGMFSQCTSLITPPPVLPGPTAYSSSTPLGGEQCYVGMFQECSSLVAVPIFIGTIVDGVSCYASAFYKCTSLKQLPALLALSLGHNCYRGMFSSCYNMDTRDSYSADYPNAYRVPIIGTGTVDSSDTLAGMLPNGFVGGITPTINTTYYTNATVIDGLVGTKWRLNDLITDTVPGSGVDWDVGIGVKWKVPVRALIAAGVGEEFGITVETWDDVLDVVTNVLTYWREATDISSTLQVSDYAGNWVYIRADDIHFVGEEYDVDEYEYSFFPGGFGSWATDENAPTFTGQLSFTIDGTPYTISGSDLYQSMLSGDSSEIVWGLLGYGDGTYDYDPYTGEFWWGDDSFKTWEIVEQREAWNDARYNSDLINWLQQNATRIYTIQFTIGNTTYQAEYGMTWEDWVNSEYNTAGFVVDNDNIHNTPPSTPGGVVIVVPNYVLNDASTLATKDETIISGKAYIAGMITANPGGGGAD